MRMENNNRLSLNYIIAPARARETTVPLQAHGDGERSLLARLLVPKLCLGTHGCEALLRVHRGSKRKQSFQDVRSQAELGNEEAAEAHASTLAVSAPGW